MRNCVAVFGALAALSGAHANIVNLGNINAINTPQTLNISGITGGPYNTFTFTTNWTFGSGQATSNQLAFNFNAGSSFNILQSLSSVTGMLPNGNPTTVTVTGRLSINVSASTALQLLYAQNAFTAGSHSATWGNTTIDFTYTTPRPRPSGVIALGVRGNTASSFSISTGGSTFDPTIGLYSELGYLLASNMQGTPGNPGLTNLSMPEGEYLLFVAGAGATLGAEDYNALAAPGAPGGTLAGLVGDGGWLETSFGEGEGHWYSFTIVPTPSAAMASVIGLAMLGTRRRRA